MVGGPRHIDGPRQRHNGRHIAGCKDGAPLPDRRIKKEIEKVKPDGFAHYDGACFAGSKARETEPVDTSKIKEDKTGSGRVSCS